MKQCIDCAFYSMWDGVCMHPTSPNLWTLREGGNADICNDFEKEVIQDDISGSIQGTNRA